MLSVEVPLRSALIQILLEWPGMASVFCPAENSLVGDGIGWQPVKNADQRKKFGLLESTSALVLFSRPTRWFPHQLRVHDQLNSINQYTGALLGLKPVLGIALLDDPSIIGSLDRSQSVFAKNYCRIYLHRPYSRYQ